jgi:hypothetical protein
MEQELRRHLLTCAELYAAARKVEIVTVARLAANDWRFFDRLDDKTFTIRKYDQVMGWFSENWPEGIDWPLNVPRPSETPDPLHPFQDDVPASAVVEAA